MSGIIDLNATACLIHIQTINKGLELLFITCLKNQ
jgi:hypothetical protein